MNQNHFFSTHIRCLLTIENKDDLTFSWFINCILRMSYDQSSRSRDFVRRSILIIGTHDEVWFDVIRAVVQFWRPSGFGIGLWYHIVLGCYFQANGSVCEVVKESRLLAVCICYCCVGVPLSHFHNRRLHQGKCEPCLGHKKIILGY